jgi:DNA processing protein
MARALSDAERRAWLRLSRTQNVGPVTFASIMARFDSAIEALVEVPHLARRGGGAALRIPSDDDAKREIDALAKLGGRIIASVESQYPQGLAALEAPPPILSVIGHVSILARDMVAIVGARNASALGRKFAQQMAHDLGEAGLVVASGMARGIDTAAHEGSLAAGTCAVVAGGVDVIYPPENETLYERIRAQGTIVSEMTLGQAPQARHFAVPGSPLDPRAKGTNRLIREGATLTESAQDVLTALRPILARSFREPGSGNMRGPRDRNIDAEADAIRDQVAEMLGPAPIEVDELIRQSGASTAAVLAVILEFELAGRLTRHPGNRVSQA